MVTRITAKPKNHVQKKKERKQTNEIKIFAFYEHIYEHFYDAFGVTILCSYNVVDDVA